MGNIIGQQVDLGVDEQIKHRQQVFGAGYNDKSIERSPQALQYLNNRSAWIKLASGISLGIPEQIIEAGFSFDEEVLTEAENDAKEKLKGILKDEGFFGDLSENEIQSLMDENLAKSFILFNGTQKLNTSAVTDPEDFTKQTSPASFTQRSGYRGSNSNITKNFDKLYGGIGGSDKGLQPMPGIIDAKIDCVNRGSIRKATVTIKAFNKLQFSIIEILYLRLGYLMLLEYGWDKYIDNIENGVLTVRNTEGTATDAGWFDGNSLTTDEIYNLIQTFRVKYKYSYDGFLGKVSNFEWTLNPDNTYDITLKLITIGSVVESLNINQPTPVLNQKQFDEKLKEARKQANLNTLNDDDYVNYAFNSTKDPDDEDYFAGDELINSLGADKFSAYLLTTIAFFPEKNINYLNLPSLFSAPFALTKYKELIPNKRQYYVRLGTLLEKIDLTCNFIVKNGNNKISKLLEFDYDDVDETKCAYIPNLISLAPHKVLFTFDVTEDYAIDETLAIQKAFKDNMEEFSSTEEGNKDVKYGKLYNTYFNLYYVADIFQSSKNQKGEVLLFKFLEKLCGAINESTGNVTNIEPVIKEDRVIYFIDQNPIEGMDLAHPPQTRTKFQIYGYSPDGQSNFVKKFDFKTKITPDLSAIISIGATANGSDTKNMDAFPLRNWNRGLINKFEANLLSDDSNLSDSNVPVKTEEQQAKEAFSEQIKDGGFTTSVSQGGYWKSYSKDRGYSFAWKNIAVKGIGGSWLSYWDSRAEHSRNKRLLAEGWRKWKRAKKIAVNQAASQTGNNIVDANYMASRNYLNYIVQAFGGGTGYSTLKSAVIRNQNDIFGNPIPNTVKTEEITISKADSLYFLMDDNSDFISRGKSAFKMYQQRIAQFNYETAKVVSSTNGFIPLDLGLTFDGMSGLVIYNKIEVDTKFLPSSYPKALKFVATKVNHEIKDNQWETSINTLSVPVTEEAVKVAVLTNNNAAQLKDANNPLTVKPPIPSTRPFKIIDNRTTAGKPDDPATYGKVITIDQFVSYFNNNAEDKFRAFAETLEQSYKGYTMTVNAVYRTFARSVQLKKQNSRNASPGRSLHNYALAFDANITDPRGKTYLKKERKPWVESGIPGVAKQLGMVWGGDFGGYIDSVHFGFDIPRNTLLTNAEEENAPETRQEAWITNDTSIVPGKPGATPTQKYTFKAINVKSTDKSKFIQRTQKSGDEVLYEYIIDYKLPDGTIKEFSSIGGQTYQRGRNFITNAEKSAIRSAERNINRVVNEYLKTLG